MSESDEQEILDENRRLPRDYYLSYFEEMLEVVGARYADLLRDDELAFLELYFEAELETRKLFIRLSQRKAPWFVQEELEYDEIESIGSALELGLNAGLFQRLGREDLSDFLATRNILQLKDLAFDLRLDLRIKKKDDLKKAILKRGDPEQIISHISDAWNVVQPRHAEALEVIRLLYFGNTHQSLSDFVVEALGHMKYESYSIDESLRRFNSREEIDQKIELRELWEYVAELVQEQDLVAISVIAEILRETDWTPLSTRSAQELINVIAYEHERAGLLVEAIQLYAHSNQPPSRERRTRILERLQRHEEALDSALEIRNSWSCEDERHFSRIIIPRLAKKLEREIEVPKRPRIPTRELVIERDFENSIEDDVLAHLELEHGFHTQNHIWKSMFGLSFWDIIFSPVAGAFENRFQLGPLDMFQPEFVSQRQELIAERLANLSKLEFLEEIIQKHSEEKFGIANDWVYWDESLKLQLELFVEHVNVKQLLEVFQLMLKDLRAYRKGFPDLFIIEDGIAKFYEVKGPGDTLSATQRMWLEEFQRIGFECGVLKVGYG